MVSLFYAALSGLVFYPPMGVPCMEQHAFFFTLLAIFTSLKANSTNSTKAKVFLWSLIPPILVKSLWVHSPPLGAKYQPGLAPWVHTFDSIDKLGLELFFQLRTR